MAWTFPARVRVRVRVRVRLHGVDLPSKLFDPLELFLDISDDRFHVLRFHSEACEGLHRVRHVARRSLADSLQLVLHLLLSRRQGIRCGLGALHLALEFLHCRDRLCRAHLALPNLGRGLGERDSVVGALLEGGEGGLDLREGRAVALELLAELLQPRLVRLGLFLVGPDAPL